MAYFPAVGRLDCGSHSTEHRGFWQLNGYGIMSIYKSDWDRFGGEWNLLPSIAYDVTSTKCFCGPSYETTPSEPHFDSTQGEKN